MARTVADSLTQHSPTDDRSTLRAGTLLSGAPSSPLHGALHGAGRDQCIVFVVASAAYLAVAIFWLARGMNAITGDEPHYLVTAQAMVRNHSLDLRPVYALPVWGWLSPEGAHTVPSGSALYPGHGLATAMLVALPYRWFGIRGAKVALCVWSGLLVSLAYRVLRSITAARGWSLATALVLALSLPNTIGGGQIYPDITAGFLRLYLVYQLARGFADPQRRALRLLGYACAVGALPWLQHRHFPVGLVFTVAFVVRFLHDASGAGRDRRARPIRDPLRSVALLAPLALMVGLQVTWSVYSLSVYGSLLYPGNAHFLGWYSVMIALGLHLDQIHGLFFQNPLLFAALAGVLPFIRRTPRVFAVWALVYVLTVAPTGAQPFGYGAWSFAGRYQWDLAPLWILPLGHFMAWLLRRRGGAAVWGTILVAALAVQGWFARRWLLTDGFLIQPWTSSVWMLDSLYGPLRWVLPVFSDPQRLLRDLPNWLWIGLAMLAMCLTLLVRTRRLAVSGMLAASALVAVLLAMPHPATPLQIPAGALLSAAGRLEGAARIASSDQDAPGYLAFGPYIALGAGCYETALSYDADAPPTGNPALWEYADEGRVLASGALSAAAGAVQHGIVQVAPGARLNKFEFRVWYTGSGRIRVRTLTIAPSPCPDVPT
jgi:hypothetical protein